MRRHRTESLKISRRGVKIIAVISAIILMFIIAGAAERSIRPISLELAESYGGSAVQKVMNETVSEFFEEREIGYSDLVRLRYNTQGSVTSVEYNTAEITKMKIDCLEKLSKNLDKIRSAKIRAPVGSLFGEISLSGRGPAIYLRISETAVPDIELLSTFESVGVNQSRHEIVMRVSADVSVYLPPRVAKFSIAQDYVLAQTVIVGEVPSGCAYLN